MMGMYFAWACYVSVERQWKSQKMLNQKQWVHFERLHRIQLTLLLDFIIHVRLFGKVKRLKWYFSGQYFVPGKLKIS